MRGEGPWGPRHAVLLDFSGGRVDSRDAAVAQTRCAVPILDAADPVVRSGDPDRAPAVPSPCRPAPVPDVAVRASRGACPLSLSIWRCVVIVSSSLEASTHAGPPMRPATCRPMLLKEQWGCQPRSARLDGSTLAGLAPGTMNSLARSRQMNVSDTERGVTLLLGCDDHGALWRRTWSTGEVAPAGGGRS